MTGCMDDLNGIRLTTACTGDPITATSAAYHSVQLDCTMRLTLYSAEATVSIVGGQHPQCGLDLDERGVAKQLVVRRLGDVAIIKPGTTTIVVKRRPSQPARTVETILTVATWYDSASAAMSRMLRPARMRECSYQVTAG